MIPLLTLDFVSWRASVAEPRQEVIIFDFMKVYPSAEEEVRWTPKSGHRLAKLSYAARCVPAVNPPAQDVKLGAGGEGAALGGAICIRMAAAVERTRLGPVVELPRLNIVFLPNASLGNVPTGQNGSPSCWWDLGLFNPALSTAGAGQ